MKHAAMTATRRVSTARVPEKSVSKKKSEIKTIDITKLTKGAMLKVKTRFSIYWVVVVDPVRKEVAVSNNSKSVLNGPDMLFFEGATVSPGSSPALDTKNIMVGASMALAYKKPRSADKRHLDTSTVEKISLVVNTVKAKHIVRKATAALAVQ